MPKENPGGVRSKKSKPHMEMQDLAANRSAALSGRGPIPGGDAHGVQAPGDVGVGGQDVPQREEKKEGEGEAVERSRSAVGAEPVYDIPLDD